MHPIFAVSPLTELSALEVHKLYKLRVDIFVHEQQCPYAEIDDIDAAPRTLHVLAWDHDRALLGTARLFPATENAQAVARIGRFAVLPEQRGKALAKDLFFQTLRLASERYPDRDVYIEAQVPLKEYYEAFEFSQCGEEYEDEGVPHIPMKLSATKLAKILANRA